MDRQITWPGAIPLETDLLNTNRNTMVGLGYLAQDTIGTSTVVSGFTCTQNSPAALNVLVTPGRIYSVQNVDNTAFSSLAANTTQQVVKQGISASTVTLSCPAPTTSGQSINYLIEATYADLDTNAVVLPYYNASNPSVAYSGPGGLGASNYTTRSGTVTLTAKAGTSATTGTQTTPAPDSGYVGMFVVTVAYGASTIVTGNITAYSGAPFLVPGTLSPLSSTVPLNGFYLPTTNTLGWATNGTPRGTIGPTGDITTRGVALCKTSATTTRASTTTLSNDPYLAIALTAGTYDVELFLIYSVPGGSGAGFAANLNYSGSAVAGFLLTDGYYGTASNSAQAPNATTFGATATLTTATYTQSPTNTGIQYLRVKGVLALTGNGTLAVAWAQVTSNASGTVVNTGSYLKATQLS